MGEYLELYLKVTALRMCFSGRTITLIWVRKTEGCASWESEALCDKFTA